MNKSIDKREIIYYNQQAFEKKAIAFVGMYVVHIYGGIAQLARVLGSYPIGRRFESHCRYQLNLLTYSGVHIKVVVVNTFFD